MYEDTSRNNIWWGPVNIKMDEHSFEINRERALDYLNTRENIYVFDGFAGVRILTISSGHPYLVLDHSSGTLTIASKCASFVLEHIMHCSCIICSYGQLPMNCEVSASPTSSYTTLDSFLLTGLQME